MTSIKIRMNVTRKNKDGQYPLIIQVIRSREKREIYTPYRLYKEEFKPTYLNSNTILRPNPLFH